MKQKNYDAIVVGGGHNGLVAASCLAKAGRSSSCSKPMTSSAAPWTSGGEKSFGFGAIVVADAFLAWGKTLTPWTNVPETTLPTTTPVGMPCVVISSRTASSCCTCTRFSSREARRQPHFTEMIYPTNDPAHRSRMMRLQ